MGRHGAGPSRRKASRVSVPLIAIAVLVVAAIGFGIWLWSVRSVSDPIDAKPVDAYAVVISSPSCTSGAGSTVIDLSIAPVVRSSLSACGRRAGERLAVQYLDGHPDQVRLAGTTVAHNSSLGRWLPIAILAAGLLAVVATVALLIERRQSRHAGARSRVSVAQLRAGLPDVDATPTPSAVVHREPSVVPALAAGTEPVTAFEGNPEVTSRIANPGFPGAPPQPFRASEIAVADDLFTHRGPEAPDR